MRRLLDTALNRYDNCVLFLTERQDCDFYPKLSTILPQGYRATEIDTLVTCIERIADGRKTFIVAGTQIATKERLEVLSIASRERVPDGLALDESIERVIAGGGVPTLTWAPGKWLGARGELITRAVNRFSCEQICLCDTSLRPLGWPEPAQFQIAKSKGMKILAGTDPLPIGGDEDVVGSFGVRISSKIDDLNGLGLRRLLREKEAEVERFGVRPDPISWAIRYGRFMLRKR